MRSEIDALREFVEVLRAEELPPGAACEVSVGGRELALVNVDGIFYAVDNACPHQDGPLGAGAVQDHSLICPWHQWEFDVRTGECFEEPDMPIRCYDTKVVDGRVLVRMTAAGGPSPES